MKRKNTLVKSKYNQKTKVRSIERCNGHSQNINIYAYSRGFLLLKRYETSQSIVILQALDKRAILDLEPRTSHFDPSQGLAEADGTYIGGEESVTTNRDDLQVPCSSQSIGNQSAASLVEIDLAYRPVYGKRIREMKEFLSAKSRQYTQI